MTRTNAKRIEEAKRTVRDLLEGDTDYTAKMRAEDFKRDDVGIYRWLLEAIRYGNAPSVLVFLEAGARPEGPISECFDFLTGKGEPVEVAKLLIQFGAKVNYRDEGGSTPLHTAAYSGDLELLKLLLAKGAKSKRRNQYTEIGGADGKIRKGETPAETAMKKGHVQVGAILAYAAGFRCMCDGFLSENESRWFVCSCGKKCLLPAEEISKESGINYICRDCGNTSYIPPEVWCNKCKQGLENGWQIRIQNAGDNSCYRPHSQEQLKEICGRKWWKFW